MQIVIDSIYEQRKINGLPNYAMYLFVHYENIAEWRGWNAETQKSYQSIYNEYILPKVNLNKAIATYDIDDVFAFCDDVTHSYKEEYSSGYIDKIIYLFHCVYIYGVHIGDFEDNLFIDDIDNISEDLSSERSIGIRGRILTVPKSLTIASLVKVATWITSRAPTEFSLYEVGFILMFLTGMRVNEVCAVTFGNLLIRCGGKVPVVAVVRSTKYKSAEHKVSGKTSNADRLIPVDWFLYRFIDLLKNERIKNGASEESLKDTPIVSTEIGEGISATTLSSHIRPLFNKLGLYSRDQMISLVMDLKSQKESLDDSYIEEKDLTAYVLRRNYSTMNAALGLTDSELQYIFGHAVEADERERFVNDDRLLTIYNKVTSNPIYYILNGRDFSIMNQKKIAVKKNKEVYIKVEAKEPSSPISYKVEVGKAEAITKRKQRISTSFGRRTDEVDILDDIRYMYMKALMEAELEEDEDAED